MSQSAHTVTNSSNGVKPWNLCNSCDCSRLSSCRDSLLPDASLHIQPLLFLPHGCQHVRPLELLHQRRLHAGQGAVHGRLPVCRYSTRTHWTVCSGVQRCGYRIQWQDLTVTKYSVRLLVFTLIWFSVCSGVVSTFVSYVCKMATGRFGPSLGAVSNDITALLFISLGIETEVHFSVPDCVCRPVLLQWFPTSGSGPHQGL